MELSCNKVRTKEHVEGCRIEGKDDLCVMMAGQAESRDGVRERNRWKEGVIILKFTHLRYSAGRLYRSRSSITFGQTNLTHISISLVRLTAVSLQHFHVTLKEQTINPYCCTSRFYGLQPGVAVIKPYGRVMTYQLLYCMFLFLHRYFIYCEILQYNTEHQRNCYSW